jgi:dTMP kinase
MGSADVETLKNQIIFEIKNSSFHDTYDYSFRLHALNYAQQLNLDYGADLLVIYSLIICTGLKNQFFDFSNYKISDEEYTFIENFLIKYIPSNKVTIVMNLINFLEKYTNYEFIEQKISFDAIQLAGFGPLGISRLYLYAGKNNMFVNDPNFLVNYFESKRKKLFLPTSQNFASKEHKFNFLFQENMKSLSIKQDKYKGAYVILEGNSGTGKTTQSKLLEKKFNEIGKDVVIVEEPTKFYKDYEDFIRANHNYDLSDSKLQFRLYSIIGDRFQQIQDTVIKELEKGNIVISVRSYISMLVYQCETENERIFINYLHGALPKPTIMLLFDAPEEICYERKIKSDSYIKKFDKLDSLRKYRPKYLDIANSQLLDFPISIINTNGPLETITEQTFNIINSYLH